METADAVEVPIWFLKPRPRQDADSMGEEGAVGDSEVLVNKETTGRWHEPQSFEQGGNQGKREY